MAGVWQSVEMLSHAQKVLFEEACALASAQKISLQEASSLIGAEPRHYVQVRNLTNNSLRDYFLVRKIKKLRALLAPEIASTNDHPIVEVLDDLFAQLEFGANPFSPEDRKNIRISILKENYSIKTVQTAFRSLAVSKCRRYIKLRKISIMHVNTMRWIRDFSIGTLIALCALVFHQINIEGCISCNLAGWTLISCYLTPAIAFLHWTLKDANRGLITIKSLMQVENLS